MIAFLWAAVLAVQMPPAIANPAQRHAMEQCQSALARKVDGEVSNVTIVTYRRIGKEILLKGRMNLLQRPASRPGEMTATHVRNILYSYECRVRGHAPPRVKVASLEG
ncbi:MAG TPA: hypothetical protein VGD66_03010 [Allosphingosinicella sp.]|jgi:hypothetical protein